MVVNGDLMRGFLMEISRLVIDRFYDKIEIFKFRAHLADIDPYISILESILIIKNS